MVTWLFLLARQLAVEGDSSPLLDTMAAALGVALGLWSTVLNRFVTGEGLPTGDVWAVYPTIDVALLVLCFHVTTKLDRLVVPMRILTFTLAMQITLDMAYSAVAALSPETDRTPLYGGYLFCFLGFALTAAHPDITLLRKRARPPLVSQRGKGQSWLILLALSPVIITTGLPASGTVDRAVRTLLVAALLTLVFLRLSHSMSALARSEAVSRHRATHDQLTGLVNRAAMLDMLQHRLEEDAEAGRSTAVLFFDCDDFKHVNDTWGHHAGDTLLRDIAHRLPDHLEDDEVLTRHGGDEFVILASKADRGEVASLAQRVREFFRTPARILPDRTHAVTASIGVAVSIPGARADSDALLQQADIAMYEAKKGGGGQFAVFEGDLTEQSRTSADIGDRLEEAIRTDALGVALQPIMGGPGHSELRGWEALARWHDPQLGDVPPERFVPIAQHLGLIHELSDALLRHACAEAAPLVAAAPHCGLTVSVNVSPEELQRDDWARTVSNTAMDAGLPLDALRLEITTRVLVNVDEATVLALEELHEIGVQVCLDDFGTGYASMGTLQQLPVDCVKLHPSLVPASAVDEAAVAQLRAVVGLIRSLGITDIVAEGVETPEQAALLDAEGIPKVQGWLFLQAPPTAELAGPRAE